MAKPATQKSKYPVDLHMHSTCSDGELSPTQLVKLARKRGLTAISITDHDCVQGYIEAASAAKNSNLQVIAGTEISAFFEREIHLLGYFVDHQHPKLNAILTAQTTVREQRFRSICSELKKLNVIIDADEILRNIDGNVGRPHIARALVQKKYVNNFNEAFHKYLGRHAPAYVESQQLHVEIAIDAIHDAGGIAVIAHPGVEKLGSKLARLQAIGLDGVEVNHPAHKRSMRTTLRSQASRLGLLISGGSDMHGHKSTCKLGDLGISVDELDAMKQKVNRRRRQLKMREITT